MRFLVDMPLSPALARWLGSQGHDAIHAVGIGLDRASDQEILERSRLERRIVVTADLDYPRLLALTQADQPGIILFRRGRYSESEAVQRLGQALAQILEADLHQSIVVIEKARIRRRRLPIEPPVD